MRQEIVDAFNDLERIDLRMGIINEHRDDYGEAMKEALASPEMRRRIRDAADELERFCDEVKRIKRRSGK